MNTLSAPTAPAPSPDYAAIKQRQRATWASGDYAVIGTTLQIVGETLAEAADIRADERVLAAARRHARVTATDYVPALLDKAGARARAESLDLDLRVADAEALPFADASFDVVISTFGVMFAPDHRRAAHEMLRVLRPGGRIAMANWTPDGFIGKLFKIIGAHVPPPAGVQPPPLWGTEAHLQALFGDAVASMRCERRHFNFRYRTPAHFVEVFRALYGPTHKAFAALDAAGAVSLDAAMTALLERMNIAAPGSLVVPSEYLEIVSTKR
jgi:SAM-dependent methyltransferase